MKPGEHAVMARAEREHWWYRGLRDAIARCLRHPELALPPRPRVLDAGCGTGETLRFLAERMEPAYLGGFDLSEEALAFAREKCPGADLHRGDLCDPTPPAEPVDLLVSLDAICIPGAERALPGFRRLVAEGLAPGGRFVLNLPAYRWLYSGHDVAVHTSQRFTASEVRAFVEALGLAVERLSYRVFLPFPLVLAARLPDLLSRARREARARSDLHAPSAGAVDGLLFRALRLENAAIARGTRLPFGSSVFAVARKPGQRNGRTW